MKVLLSVTSGVFKCSARSIENSSITCGYYFAAFLALLITLVSSLLFLLISYLSNFIATNFFWKVLDPLGLYIMLCIVYSRSTGTVFGYSAGKLICFGWLISGPREICTKYYGIQDALLGSVESGSCYVNFKDFSVISTSQLMRSSFDFSPWGWRNFELFVTFFSMLFISNLGVLFLFETAMPYIGALLANVDEPGLAEMAPGFCAFTSWSELCEVVLFWVSFLFG